jgi:hypothetical protein
MNALSPKARRKHLEQQQQLRSTRQLDVKRRQTSNSGVTKYFLPDDPEKIKHKKKQKISNEKSIEANNKDEQTGKPLLVPVGEQQQLCNITSRIRESVEPENDEASSTSSDNVSIESDNCSIKIDKKTTAALSNITVGSQQNIEVVKNVKHYNKQVILGGGHFSMLHAYVRDDLFKRIKILSNDHLETNGEIMKTCLKKINYSEKINGNLLAFANACRAEIRKTMCSRRGYVKRQIGFVLTGMSILLYS